MRVAIAMFAELPIDQVEADPHNPRREGESIISEGDDHRLLRSLREIGMQQPLIVKRFSQNKHLIIDGHRRYFGAKKLGWKTVPCRVYGDLPQGELERLRFEAQTNRREWKPLERADAINRFKVAKKCQSNREVASYLNLSETTVRYSLAIREQNMRHMELMHKYHLKETYQNKLIGLIGRIHKIGDLEVNDILDILADKIHRKVIRQARDLSKLKRAFMRSTTNEKELLHFLKTPDATLEELERKTVQSSTVLMGENLLKVLAEKKQKNERLAPQEKPVFIQLAELIKFVAAD